MSVKIVTVSGFSKGVGKTSLICLLLGYFEGWGVLKVTPIHKGECPEGKNCKICGSISEGHLILEGDEIISGARTDTRKFSDAGASRVVWLKSKPESLKEGIEEALKLFSRVPGVFLEGNSFLKYLKPDLAIMLSRSGLDEIKPSVHEILHDLDYFAINISSGSPEEEMESAFKRVSRLREKLKKEAGIFLVNLSQPWWEGNLFFVEKVRERFSPLPQLQRDLKR